MLLSDSPLRPSLKTCLCPALLVALLGSCDSGSDAHPTPATGYGGAPSYGGGGGRVVTGSGGATGGNAAGGATAKAGAANGGSTGLGGVGQGGAVLGQGGTVIGSGGTVATGGTSPGTGGTLAQGGSGLGGAAQGGAAQGGAAQGGAGRGGAAQGGAGQGGSGRGGAGQGGAGVGGDTTTTCDLSGSPSPGNAAFTWYTLTQGSYVENGHYQVACGYHGQGEGQSPDVIQNIADSGHFVAIPGQDSSNFENVKYCGSCVELQGQNGSKVIATVVDECPLNSNPICQRNGALDVSKTAFDKLGFSVGDPSGTTWKFVPCPVTGNIKVRIKPGNPNMIFIENTILGIKSVSMNGQQASRTSYGCWEFGGNISSGANLELTDMADRKLTITVENTTADQDQDTGKQLPACK